MKPRDLLHISLNALLAFAAGFCGAGCLVTGFDLPVSLVQLAWICGIVSLLAGVCLHFRWGFLVILAGGILTVEYLTETNVWPQLQQLLYEPMHSCHLAYGTPIASFAVDGGLKDLTLILGILAALGSLTAAVSLSRRRSAGAVIAQLLFLLPCLLVTDTQPDSVFIFWLLATMALILLTHGTRRKDAFEGSKLVALLMVPVLLSNWCVLTLRPRQDYKPPQTVALIEKLDALLQKLPFFDHGPTGSGPEVPSTQPPVNMETVDLGYIGPKDSSQQIVMRVHSVNEGLLYLRGRSYATYDGRRWIADAGEETLAVLDRTYLVKGGTSVHPISVTTQTVLPLLYQGYYQKDMVLENGRVPNEDGKTVYILPVSNLNKNWKMHWISRHDGKITLETMSQYTQGYAPYLQLPEQTRTGAQKLLRDYGVREDMNVLRAAELIAQQVRNSADYQLDAPYMDAGETDFALWFLEEGDAGYCVHFATAAVVLLRAAGIPARYVEGYAVTLQANLEKPVRQSNAHAWVEYYVPQVGWVILEPTPSQFQQELPVQTVPPVIRPTVPTAPPTTTTPTMPTEPSLPTQGPTGPSTGLTKPTKPTVGTSVPATTPSQSGTDSPGETSVPAESPIIPVRQWDWTVLWQVVKWLAWAALGLFALLTQRQLRLYLRRRRLHRGDSNHRAVTAWHYAKYLARLRRQKPPEALQELAQKARFSQHRLTDAELEQFAAYFHRSVEHLKHRPWPLRLVYRWILVIW